MAECNGENLTALVLDAGGTNWSLPVASLLLLATFDAGRVTRERKTRWHVEVSLNE